ncbi:hypothetical protein NX059_002583 [Plenodomus lindquistii]|nr:hypothetical protein NX059_002583 [Plenodomus lindquistii]
MASLGLKSGQQQTLAVKLVDLECPVGLCDSMTSSTLRSTLGTELWDRRSPLV